jgi:type IV pilus assembly protein PilB
MEAVGTLPLDDPSEPPHAHHARARRRLGEVLVAKGTISPDQLEQALSRQHETAPGQRRRRLGAVLVELGYATEEEIAAALAEALGLELVDLSRQPVPREIIRVLPRAVARRHGVIPIAETENGGLVIAASDPTNVVALDDVKAYTGVLELQLTVAVASQISSQLDRAWSLSDSAPSVATMIDELDTYETEEPDAVADIESAPTVRLLNDVFADASRARASDIHVETQARQVLIRYRVDGVLRDVMTVPRSAAAGMVSRIKVMSNLNIAERRVPQDGRTRISVDGALIDCRVSTLPSLHGEKVVIRLLARADSVTPVDQLGMDEEQMQAFRRALATPQGLVLITGPTGSGKTNTLYSAISEIRNSALNILTLEDPVEIQLPGITQVQVNERTGMTFARGLRSLLRQDPDIVLVGEVRDAETAKLALEASLTGHLVLTTLHTNNAPAALTRLVDMGVETFLVASSLSLVAAQRLVRRVCESCAQADEPDEATLAVLELRQADLATATLRRGRGCNQCGGTGYLGRIGIFEVLPITSMLRSVLLQTPTEGAVAAAARAAGMRTIRGAALAKAWSGQTSLAEVMRVTAEDAAGGTRCPTCDRAVEADMVVCPWCATQLNRGRCRACHRAMDTEWRICPWCATLPALSATGN